MDQPYPVEIDPDPWILWESAKCGHVEDCRDLLQMNSGIRGYVDNTDNEHGTTPLIAALEWSGIYARKFDFDHIRHHLAVVELLLYYGADASMICENGTDALHNAIIHTPSNEYLFVLLRKLGRNQLETKVNGLTALMYAIQFTDRVMIDDQVTALLRHGADAHTVDNKGNSILHQIGSDSQWLLDIVKPYHVDINRRGDGGRTPIQFHIYRHRMSHRSGHFAHGIALLLANNVDISIVDDDGETAVQNAASFLPPDNEGLLLLQYREKEIECRENERERMLAFAMGTHARNNPDCLVQPFGMEYMKMFADASGFDPNRPF